MSKGDGSSRAATLDLRLSAEDRAGPAKEPKQRGSKTRKAPEKDKIANRVEPRMDSKPEPKPRAAREKKPKESPAPLRATKPKGQSLSSRKRSFLGGLAYWSCVLGIWGVIAAGGLFTWVGMHLPPIQSLAIPKRPPTTIINASDGRMIATRGEMGGAAIPLKEMPAHLPNAFIAIEDRRFYSHHGVDPIGLFRAVLANVTHRGISQGGSTITQQLAKNLFLTPDRKLMRKLQEAMLAVWLEHKFTKQEILELYLNRIYFGSGAYGVEAAAQRYFGKSARHVTVGEAALLAGLVKSPTKLQPNRNFDAAERRSQIVLASMSDAGLITDAVAKGAMASAPVIVRSNSNASSNYVADWVTDVVYDLMGRVDDDIVVDTTIDPAQQAAAEKALVEQLAQKGEKFGVEQGALVAMSPDGAVRALVGGRNYAENQFNRAVVAKRQPGSTFKPFVYLTALEHGLGPDTLREDKPIDVKGWKPENFNHEYFGPVTLTQALSKSLNSISVRLTMEFGPTAVVRTAHRLGISSKLEPNPSIGLGTSEVSVLEMVSAYVPFANGGIAVVPHVVERIRPVRGGKPLYTRNLNPLGRVVDARYVAMMNMMMHETVASGTARKADIPGWTVAGKTGTSQDFRDAWFIGYTSQLVTGVWLGNDNNAPTHKATGGSLPVDVWSAFMKTALRGKAPADLPTANMPLAFAPPAPVPPGAVAGAPLAPIPAPPSAPVPNDRGRGPVRPEEGTIDGWFLNRLFSSGR